MTTHQFFTTAPGAVQSRAHLSKASCTRMSRLSLLKGEGRVRVPLDILVVQASNPSPPSSPLLQGERRQKPIEQP
jgi:hypothetical protein